MRTWTLRAPHDGDFALVGYGATVWEPDGRPTRAECRGAGGSRCRSAPSPDCGCGLYGRHPFADEAALALDVPDPDDPLQVAGIVEAWGEVELHGGGFRAEYARPTALAVPGSWRRSDYAALVERVADRHRARVLHVDSPADLLAHCREHGLGLDEATVDRLLANREGARPPASRIPAAPPPPRTRAGRVVDGVRLFGAWLVAILFLVVVTGFGYAILAAVLGWEAERDGPGAAALHGGRSLKVIDQELAPGKRGRWLYLATVRNTGDRAAIGVVPEGRLRDRGGRRVARIDRPGRVEGRANLAPGETGLVWDRLRPRPGGRRRSDVRRFDVEAGAMRLAGGPDSAPISIARVHSNRELCIVTATIDARARIRRARVALVGRDPKGKALGVGRSRVGPLARGRGEHLVGRIPPWACRDPRLGVDAYPALTRRQLLGATG